MNKTTSGTSGKGKPTLGLYVSGYILSLVFTLTAYFATTRRTFAHRPLVALVAGLALAQFIVQLVFFLHVGHETRPRWKFISFWGMVLVVLILVFGSLWIMSNLNTNMMSPQAVQRYMNDQDGL